MNGGTPVQDANSKLTTSVYLANRNLVEATVNAMGYRTVYVHDSQSRLVSTRDANGGFVTNVFDSAGYLAAVLNQLGERARQYGYDLAGRVVTFSDAAGRLRTHTFDAAGQNTATQFPDGKIVTNQFDRIGQRTTMIDWGGTSTYTFNGRGNPSGQTDAAGFVQAYGYDPNGNRTSLNLVATGLFTYTFDSLNRLAAAMKPGNQLYTMMYDADSRRTTMMLGNGSTRQYAYDSRSQLTTQVELNASNTPVVTLIDTYGAVGNRMTRSVNGTISSWTYDDLYRLTGQVKPGQVATYTLDGVGNLKTMWEGGPYPKTFTVDAADKIVTMVEGVDLTTYTYTGYGALGSEVTGNATTAYSYNGQDQLVGVTDATGVKSTYTFDGDGLRRTAQNGNVLPTTMVWDGADYLLLNGPSANQLVLTLGSEIASCGDFDLLPDSLGSVIGDIRVGFDPRLLYEYWPYGTRADAAGSAPFPFLYVGNLGYHHDAADRDYVRARELYKRLGRWMQLDPLWPEESAFAYGACNPVLLPDPAGLSCQSNACMEGITITAPNACYGLSDDLVPEVNRCLREALAGQSRLRCNDVTSGTMQCLRDRCKQPPRIEYLPATCKNGKTCMDIDCSRNYLRVCCELMLAGRCGLGGGNDWETVYLHELLHCCGYDHPDDTPGSSTCNSVVACCILKVKNKKRKDYKKCKPKFYKSR